MDAVQVSVAPEEVIAEATGFPGLDGGVVSSGGTVPPLSA
ncbi:hypothetical protein FHR32_005449 [Streptosporangium album]|uniref:Uncharacterized protein n=1 Tax=Streptosporangium album TaxID=47479 RepID=A0A7W7RZR5_9ACTN|nr:hypothetical protein [Streptosporangium album]